MFSVKRLHLIDKLKVLCYNIFVYHNAEVEVLSNQHKCTLSRNEELGFLYKNCTKIRSYVISEIALVPEFMESLKGYTGTLDDGSVYEVLKKTYKQMLADGKGYRTAKAVVSKISKDVTGDSASWRNE